MTTILLGIMPVLESDPDVKPQIPPTSLENNGAPPRFGGRRPTSFGDGYPDPFHPYVFRGSVEALINKPVPVEEVVRTISLPRNIVDTLTHPLLDYNQEPEDTI